MNSPENGVEKVVTKSAIELLGMNEEEEKAELKERVGVFDGLVRVFIHPITEYQKGYEVANHDRVYKVLGKTIFSENAPPILIFDNARDIARWHKIVEKTDLPNDIYLVPTLLDFPYPLLAGRPLEDGIDERGYLNDKGMEYAKQSMASFITLLNELGVKKVLVGGTSLIIVEGTLAHCVGNFIELMKEYSDKEIKLSMGTAPLNRSDIRESRPDLL